jgi:hypothetical protein
MAASHGVAWVIEARLATGGGVLAPLRAISPFQQNLIHLHS